MVSDRSTTTDCPMIQPGTGAFLAQLQEHVFSVTPAAGALESDHRASRRKGATGSKKSYVHTKVGCKTCKKRKVRCDETWPTCRNCTRAGRQCDGVDSATILKFIEPMTLSRFRFAHGNAHRAAPEEVAYLDMFRHRLIFGIVGDVPRPSWTQLILQAVHDEPALYHGAVAYSALVGLGHEPVPAMLTEGGVTIASPTQLPAKQVALRHYNQCIRHLQEIINRGDHQSLNVGLLCILLCIVFELRFKNPYLALTHLGHSLKIIKASSDPVDDDLVMAFARLDLLASVFSDVRVPTMSTQELEVCNNGPGDQKADNDITRLSTSIFTFLRTKANSEKYRSNHAIPPSIRAEAQSLERALDAYSSTYLSPQLPEAADAISMTSGEKFVWLKYLTARIMLGVCFDKEELAYDRYVHEFSAIAALADKLVRNQERANLNQPGIDMCLIPPVYLAAQKCRTPLVRRHAIQLLARIHALEGVWDVTICEEYARRMLRLEEDGLVFDSDNLEEVRAEQIPESQRIHSLDVIPNFDQQCSTLYFRRRSQNEAEEWDTIVEVLKWK